MKKGSIVFVGLLILLAFFFVACEPIADGMVSSARGNQLEAAENAAAKDAYDKKVEAELKENKDAKEVAWSIKNPSTIRVSMFNYLSADLKFFVTAKAGDKTEEQLEAARYSFGVSYTQAGKTTDPATITGTLVQRESIDMYAREWSSSATNWVTVSNSFAAFVVSQQPNVNNDYDHVNLLVRDGAAAAAAAAPITIPVWKDVEFQDDNWVYKTQVKETIGTGASAVAYLREHLSEEFHDRAIAARARTSTASATLTVTNYNRLMTRNPTVSTKATTNITYVNDYLLNKVDVVSSPVSASAQITTDTLVLGPVTTTAADLTDVKLGGYETGYFDIKLTRKVVPTHVTVSSTNESVNYLGNEVPEELTGDDFTIWGYKSGAIFENKVATGFFVIDRVEELEDERDERDDYKTVTKPAGEDGVVLSRTFRVFVKDILLDETVTSPTADNIANDSATNKDRIRAGQNVILQFNHDDVSPMFFAVSFVDITFQIP